MRKKSNLRTAVLFLAAAVMTLALTGCQLAKEDQARAQSDRLIGALVWAADRDDSQNAPEESSISFERAAAEDGERTEIKCSEPDMLGAYVVAERKDGEVQSIDFQADDRFVSAPGLANIGGANEIEATLYFDPAREFYVFVYSVYERADGSLYARRDDACCAFGKAGGGNTVEGKTGDWAVRIQFYYEPFEACDKMALLQFDENDSCISRTEFAPEDDVQLKKAQGCAYAVCQYIKGRQSSYKLVEDDTALQVVFNSATGIGEMKRVKLE